MVKPRDDMRLLVGMASNGAALPLRTDSAGRLELVNERTVHAARIYHNANQSVGNASWTALAMNSEELDSDGFHDLVTNNSRITIVHSGIYLVGCCTLFALNTSGMRSVGIRKNGSAFLVYQHGGAFATYGVQLAVATLAALNAGDYIESMAFQNSGGALNAEVATGSPVFWVVRL